MFDHFADYIEENPLHKLWKKYGNINNIADALVVVKEEMDVIKPAALNKAWWKLWENVVNDACFPRVNEVEKKIIDSAQRMGFTFIEIQANQWPAQVSNFGDKWESTPIDEGEDKSSNQN